jgi:hypothetical protein
MHTPKKIILDELEKKQVFAVPEQYFEQLPHQIQQKVTTKKQSLLVINRAGIVRYSLATLLLVITIGYLFYSNPTTDQATTSQILSNIPDDEIATYLGNSGEVSQQDWIEVASKANVQVGVPGLSDLPISEEVVSEEIDPSILEE